MVRAVSFQCVKQVEESEELLGVLRELDSWVPVDVAQITSKLVMYNDDDKSSPYCLW